MFETYFDFNELFLIVSGILCAVMAIFFHEIKGKDKTAIFLLIISALLIRIFAASLDPFYNLWDEQYHALVAKSMMINPLKPTLYADPALPYWYPDWGKNHIWLHKQPLFLWQIALSFKFFGISPFTLRFPSIILSALVVLLTYEIARMLFNKKVAFYAALLISAHNVVLRLLSGEIATDHNDVSFLFYVTASIWAWLKYLDKKTWKWVIWIGVFSGLAILNKWLTGFLVYFGWVWLILFTQKYKETDTYKHFFLALGITFLVFLPWQFFIFAKYPLESNWEFNYNSMHFYKVIENHGGNFWYHFQIFGDMYHSFFRYILVLGLIVMLFRYRSDNKWIIFSLIANIIIVYVFFSFAKTKMLAFTMLVSPLIFIFIAYLISKSLDLIYKQFKIKTFLIKIIGSLIIFILFISLLNIKRIQYFHTDKAAEIKGFRGNRIAAYMLGKQIDDMLNNEKFVIFNLPLYSDIVVMLHSKHTAYDKIPSIEEIKFLKNTDRKIAIFENDFTPAFIMSDTSILKIKSAIWGDISNVKNQNKMEYECWK